jgi:hypothetical protein
LLRNSSFRLSAKREISAIGNDGTGPKALRVIRKISPFSC